MKKKVLFVYPSFSTFVKTDYEILSEEYEVTKYHFNQVKGNIRGLIQLLKQFIFLCINGWKFDIFYIWFADYHSFLPVFFAKLFSTKSFVVVGGYDVARIRKLGYGAFITSVRGWAAKYSMKNCTLSLPVSSYVARKVKAITGRTNNFTIYNCINLEKAAVPKQVKRDIILTVVKVDNQRTYLIKGLDTYIEIARQLPEFQFYIVGLDVNKFAREISEFPANTQVFGFVEHQKLIEFYSRTMIYCQLSRSESFGVALAEAMFYGCISLIINEGGMPEIVGNDGIMVKRNVEEIASKIKDIFHNKYKFNSTEISDRVNSNFSLQIRENRIKKLLRDNI